MAITKRAVLLFALSLPAALILVSLWPEWWFASVYYPAAVLALLVADINMSLPRRRLTFAVDTPAGIPLGKRGRVAVQLETDPLKRPLEVIALLEVDGDADKPEPVTGTLLDKPLTMTLPVTPVRRGRLGFTAVWLRWRGPLGLVETRCRLPVGTIANVVTNIRGIRDDALRFHIRDAWHGSKSQRPHGEGTEFDKLAEYEKGMDSRFIDWKRSARHRKLFCREFRQERNHHIILGFDTGHLMLEPVDGMPRLDHALNAGLRLGLISLREGDLVGCCGFDATFRGFLAPGRGTPYFTRLQRFATGLDYRTEETNYTLGLTELGERLRQRSMVIVFSDFVDSISAELLAENLALMTKKHVVILVASPDPLLPELRDRFPGSFTDTARSVIADSFLRERAAVLERIARTGVHCVDVPAPMLPSALINRYMMIKQKGLL